MLEGRQFAVYTDHKPLIYAFNKNQLQNSPRQARHLEFISQFYNWHPLCYWKKEHSSRCTIKDKRNQLSNQYWDTNGGTRRKQRISKDLRRKTTRNKLKKIPIPGSDKQVYCDTIKEESRLYVTQLFRKQVFLSLHDLTHPGVKATIRLITERYTWINTKRLHAMDTSMPTVPEVKSRHNKTPTGNFIAPTKRFEHTPI